MQFPGQDALCLLMLPAFKLGQLQDQARPLNEREKTQLAEYQKQFQKLTEESNKFPPSLLKHDPDFLINLTQLMNKINNELSSSLETNQASDSVLPRIARFIGYLENRLKAVKKWHAYLEKDSDAVNYPSMNIPMKPQQKSSWLELLPSSFSLWRHPFSNSPERPALG